MTDVQPRQTSGGGRILSILFEILANFALPFVIFLLAQPRWGDARALMAASVAPIAWSLIEFARHRRLDALSIIVLAGIVLSITGVLLGGSPRLLQLRETLVAGVVGMVFLVSAVIGRPLIYYLARAGMRRRSAEAAASFEARRQDGPFRRVMTTLTLVWGFGLVVGTALCVALVFALSVREYLLVGPIVGYGAIGALTVWTYWYARRRLRQ